MEKLGGSGNCVTIFLKAPIGHKGEEPRLGSVLVCLLHQTKVKVFNKCYRRSCLLTSDKATTEVFYKTCIEPCVYSGSSFLVTHP